jgi:hypothetical protein
MAWLASGGRIGDGPGSSPVGSVQRSGLGTGLDVSGLASGPGLAAGTVAGRAAEVCRHGHDGRGGRHAGPDCRGAPGLTS